MSLVTYISLQKNIIQSNNTGRKVEFPAIGKVKYSYLTDHMSFTFPTSGQMSWW